jgi:hypothetical protein
MHLHRLIDYYGVALQSPECFMFTFGKEKNIYEALLKYGIQSENQFMINVAIKQLENQKEVLNYTKATKLIENLLFNNNSKNSITLLQNALLLPSKNKPLPL